MLFSVSTYLWIPKKMTVLRDTVFCIRELLLLMLFKSREWTSILVWISKQEIRAKLRLSSPNNLDGIVPLQDIIKMNFTELGLSVNAEDGDGLDCGVLILHCRDFPIEQPNRDWLCRFLSLHSAVRKCYL